MQTYICVPYLFQRIASQLYSEHESLTFSQSFSLYPLLDVTSCPLVTSRCFPAALAQWQEQMLTFWKPSDKQNFSSPPTVVWAWKAVDICSQRFLHNKANTSPQSLGTTHQQWHIRTQQFLAISSNVNWQLRFEVVLMMHPEMHLERWGSTCQAGRVQSVTRPKLILYLL